MTAEKGKPLTKCNKVEKPAPTTRECPCVTTWRGNPTTTTTTTTLKGMHFLSRPFFCYPDVAVQVYM